MSSDGLSFLWTAELAFRWEFFISGPEPTPATALDRNGVISLLRQLSPKKRQSIGALDG
jgi:hypothetical protein